MLIPLSSLNYPDVFEVDGECYFVRQHHTFQLENRIDQYTACYMVRANCRATHFFVSSMMVERRTQGDSK